MILLIEKKDFINAIHTTARFTERSGMSLPILSSILILSTSDGIKFRATNLETGIDFKVKGTHKGEGVLAIPGDTALLKIGSAQSSIRTTPPEDFPNIPIPESPKGRVVLSGVTIKNLLSSIAGCASTSSVRPELASVYFSIEGGTCTAVATDSFRLAEKKIALTLSTG